MTDSAMTTGMDALDLRGLRKSYGSTVAVDGVDLAVPAGSFYGLVGPNGAGSVGVLPSGLALPGRLTGRERSPGRRLLG